MNKIKLIALDLDGTALTPQNKVAETTTDAVRRAREAGVYVAVSTGRICGEARDFAVDLDAGKAVVSGKTLPEDAVLTAAVTEAGYKVVDIK